MNALKFVHKWGWNILIAVNQTINAIMFGDPDETISSRAAKHLGHRDGWHWLATFLDFIDPGHSRNAIEHDEGKDALLP